MNIGFIGLGHMGQAMVRNLLADGFTLTVHDIHRETAIPLEEMGATWADSPRAVAQVSDVIMSSLPGPPEVEAVTLGPSGIIEAIKEGSVYIDLSTISPNLIRRIHQAFRERGADVLDAPVSGTPANRKMVIMVGGNRKTFDRCQSILGHLGDKIIYVGDIGAGAICKLVHNCIYQATRFVVVEGLTLGVKAGVNPKDLWRAVRWGAYGRATPITGMENDLFAGKFDLTTFSLKLASKDISLAIQMAQECQASMPLTILAEQQLLEAMARGWGDREYTAADVLQEERAGVEVRIPDFSPE